MAHYDMRINDLFSFIAENVHSRDERASIYETIREILKVRKNLRIKNNAVSMLNSYDDLFDYFIDNYSPEESDKHIRNLDKLHDSYFSHPIGDSSDEDDVEGSEDDSTDEESSDASEEESDSDSESSEDDDGANNKLDLYLDIDYDEIHDVVKKQHKKTRWWISANMVLSLAQIALSVFTVAHLLQK